MALASVASSFFVYPVQKAQAFVDCADTNESAVKGSVVISKPRLHVGEKLRWFASYALEENTTGGTIVSPIPCKDVKVFFWVSSSANAQNIKYLGTWDDQIGEHGGYKAGGEFIPTVPSGAEFPIDAGLEVRVEEEGDNDSLYEMDVVEDPPTDRFEIVTGNVDTSAVNDPAPPVLDSPVLDGGTTGFLGKTWNLGSSGGDVFGITTTSFAAEYRVAPEDTSVNVRYKVEWGAPSNPSDPKTYPVLGSSSVGTYDHRLNVNWLDAVEPSLRAIYVGYAKGTEKVSCFENFIESNDCPGDRANKTKSSRTTQALPNENVLVIPISDLGLTTPTGAEPTAMQLKVFSLVDLDYGNFTLIPGKFRDYAYDSAVVTVTVKLYKDAAARNASFPEGQQNQDKPQEFGGPVSATASNSSDNNNSGADGIIKFIASVISAIVSFINVLIYNIFSLVILPLLITLLNIRTYTDAFAQVILPGWELLRNLANIFFIVVLLVIGLATLFRVQKYQYKNLLVNLILAALLVNFSLVITQSVLAVAETVQNQFLPNESKLPEGERGIALKVIANRLMIAPIEQEKTTPPEFTADGRLSDALAQLVFPIFYLSLSIMAFVVFVFLVFFVIIRLLVIWVLLMTSPIAFVAWILPDTNRWTSKWLDNLMKYGFFVAILGFFLNIAAYVAQQQRGVLESLYASGNNNSGIAQFLSLVATNIFVMGFLVAGVMFASSIGVIGAKALGKYAKMGGMLPFKAIGKGLGGIGKGLGQGAKALGERGFEGIQNKTGVTVDPREWKKGYQSYMKSRAEEREKRIKKRKMGDSWVGNKFGKGVGSALGSPEQFLENFALTEGGMKTLGKKITGSKFFDNLKAKKDIAQKRAENVKDIKTEDERHALSEKIRKLETEQSGKVVVGAKSDAAKETIQELKKQKKALDGQADLAAQNGWPDTERDVKKRAADLQKVIDEIEAETRDLTDDAVIADISAATNQGVAEMIKNKVKSITDQLETERPNHQDEIDKLKALEADDDRARQDNGFDAFNNNPPTDGTYKKFDAEMKGKIDTAAHEASQAVDSMNFKQLLKASAETAKDQAKIMAEYKERGLGEDGSAIIAEMESIRGKKDEKDRRDVLWQLAAANGHTGMLLDYHGKNKTGEGLLELMKQQYKATNERDSDYKENLKRMVSVLQKTDEFHKRNGEHAYSYMTQRAGAQVVPRSPDSQQAAVQAAIANMNTSAFLKSPEANFFNITVNQKTGQSVRVLTEGAKKRFEAMDPSEANRVISDLPPAMRKKLVDSPGFDKIKWKTRSEKDNKKGAKYKSVEEAIRSSI